MMIGAVGMRMGMKNKKCYRFGDEKQKVLPDWVVFSDEVLYGGVLGENFSPNHVL